MGVCGEHLSFAVTVIWTDEAADDLSKDTGPTEGFFCSHEWLASPQACWRFPSRQVHPSSSPVLPNSQVLAEPTENSGELAAVPLGPRTVAQLTVGLSTPRTGELIPGGLWAQHGADTRGSGEPQSFPGQGFAFRCLTTLVSLWT